MKDLRPEPVTQACHAGSSPSTPPLAGVRAQSYHLGVSKPLFVVDPADPRAPPAETWAAMSAAERADVLAQLPSESRLYPPQGDTHRESVEQTRDPLRGFFDRIGRRVYLSSDLAVYYPGERVFAPDLIAVLDVDPHPREHWVVSHEGKGLDLILEVHVHGDVRKDFDGNVTRYARLGIPEYFVYEPSKGMVRGYRLEPADERVYRPILGQGGRFASRVLGLDLGVADGRLRYFYGEAVIPETRELLERAQALTDSLLHRLERAERRAEAEEQRAQAEEQRAQAEQQRAQAEQQRADAAEARLADALRELEALRRGR